MKKILVLIIILSVFSINTYAFENYEAKTPEYTFMVFNEPLVDFPVYSINGVNYIPINIMAQFFGFHLEIDEEQPEHIELLSGLDENAERISTDMGIFVKDTKRSVEQSKYEIHYDGKPMGAPLLNIDGYNFIQLEHAAVFFGVGVYTNEDTKTVNISNDPMDALSREEKAVYHDYLMESAIPVDVYSQGNKNIFDDIGLEKYNIYLIGERHATAKNFDLQLYFIKYLYENHGVQYIISENGYCDAQLLNRYLQTGDSRILENMMLNLKGTFAYSKEMSQFYENLYKYNMTLPDNAKLSFIGIDIQHQTITGIDYLLSLVSDKEMPEILQNSVKVLEQAKMAAEASESDFILFRLDKEGSIFTKDGSTGTQQYLLLIKDSPATEMYSDN